METMSKYDMKCFRCNQAYQIESKLIKIDDECRPKVTGWKCPVCTLYNESYCDKCDACGLDKPLSHLFYCVFICILSQIVCF